jgi:hypothetical protein
MYWSRALSLVCEVALISCGSMMGIGGRMDIVFPYSRGDHSQLYFAYTCVRDLFMGGGIYLAKKIIR